MVRLGLIITGGGASARYGRPKLLEYLGDLPVFCHSIRNFSRMQGVVATILVVPAEREAVFAQFLQQFLPDLAPQVSLVVGGQTRTESVHRGLMALPDAIDYVAVHDAARPLATASLLRRCLDEAMEYGAAIAAHRTVDTVKLAEGQAIARTLDRKLLWGAETPQVARRALLLQAYSHRQDHPELPEPTDEAQLLENAGLPVRLVESAFPNPKLTTPADLALLKALI